MANQDPDPKKSALNPLAAPFEPNSGRDVEVNEAKPTQQLDAHFVESKPLTEFHPFKRLPSELRLKIWKLHMPGARIIQLRYSKRIYHAVSPNPAPTLLHVCHESREEALKHYTLLSNSHYVSPRIFINPEVDTLVFSEKRGREFPEVLIHNKPVYWDYFKHMTKNMNPSLLTTLRRIGISDQIYCGNINWDHERGDVFNLTKFTNLDMAAIVFDAGKKMVGPVKLVQLTWGECPVHTVPRRSKPDYDGDEVLHSCNLCYCPFIQEATLQLKVDHIYFEQLRGGLGAMFSEFEKRKLPGWKVPKTKAMVMTEQDRDVKKGSSESYFRNSTPSSCRPRTPNWANITDGGKRDVRMAPPRRRSVCF